MIKNIAWNTFKNTGDINTFLEFKQISEIEKQIKNNEINFEIGSGIQKVEQDGDNKNEWYNNFGK